MSEQISAERQNDFSPNAAPFLLVHGGFHGSWCWDKLLPMMWARGYRAEAVDLPYPDDKEASSIDLLDCWASQVIARAQSYREPVILVGHSRGGLIISEAAERAPESCARLIYCGAVLAGDGETTADVRSRIGGEASSAPLVVHQAPTNGLIVADADSAAATIYSDCSPADIVWALKRLRAETAAGLKIAPRLTTNRYGTVPRAAIECINDLILSIHLQRAMRLTQPCDTVLTLHCDHAPFLSDPEGLCDTLVRIAAS